MKKCPYCAKELQDEDGEELKRKIGCIILGISLVIFVISMNFSLPINFSRFLTFAAFSFFGLGIRSCYYYQWFVKESKIVNIRGTWRSYIFYLTMLTIITCLIYLGFYQAIKELTEWHFWFLYFVLFFSMGLTVETMIDKFGL